MEWQGGIEHCSTGGYSMYQSLTFLGLEARYIFFVWYKPFNRSNPHFLCLNPHCSKLQVPSCDIFSRFALLWQAQDVILWVNLHILGPCPSSNPLEGPKKWPAVLPDHGRWFDMIWGGEATQTSVDLSCKNGNLTCKQAKGIKYRMVTQPTRIVGHVVGTRAKSGVLLFKIWIDDLQDWVSTQIHPIL